MARSLEMFSDRADRAWARLPSQSVQLPWEVSFQSCLELPLSLNFERPARVRVPERSVVPVETKKPRVHGQSVLSVAVKVSAKPWHEAIGRMAGCVWHCCALPCRCRWHAGFGRAVVQHSQRLCAQGHRNNSPQTFVSEPLRNVGRLRSSVALSGDGESVLDVLSSLGAFRGAMVETWRVHSVRQLVSRRPRPESRGLHDLEPSYCGPLQRFRGQGSSAPPCACSSCGGGQIPRECSGLR